MNDTDTPETIMNCKEKFKQNLEVFVTFISYRLKQIQSVHYVVLSKKSTWFKVVRVPRSSFGAISAMKTGTLTIHHVYGEFLAIWKWNEILLI